MSMKDNGTRRSSFIMPLLRHNDPGSCGSSNASTTSSSNSIDPGDVNKSFVSTPQNLARSRSFGGLWQSGTSSTSSRRNHTNMNSVRASGTWTPGVLGQGYNSPGVSRKLMNSLGTLTSTQSPFSPLNNSHHQNHHQFGGSLKSIPASIPKTPRPNKARAAFEALTEGLKGCITVAEEEISSLKEGVREMSLGDGQGFHGRIYEYEKTTKTTERTLKKLEYQLSRVEELVEQYGLQQRLREGVRAMAYAFSISEGKERDSALANVKAGFKECTDVLCSLEGQLESYLGTFKMSMKGIQGFARLCPGDVFEITIKHGIQRWKTRGKVQKDGSQTWDLPHARFRAVLGEVMYIKAAEVKTLGKQILLGNKFCEATELFSAHPQLMTVNLNPSGSLKLNIVVTWCPCPSSLEDLNYGTHSSATSASPSTRKRRLSPTTPDSIGNGGMSVNSSILPMHHSLNSMMGSVSSRNSTPLWERTLASSIDDTVESTSFRFSSLTGSKSARLNHKQDEHCLQSTTATTASQHQPRRGSLSSDPSGNFSLRKRDSDDSCGVPSSVKETAILEETNNGDDLNSLTHSKNGIMLIEEEEDALDGLKTLRDSILKLISFLEDIKWPELENLENHLECLEKMIHEGPGVVNSSSSSSLNIESALECFDFLDSVVVEEGIGLDQFLPQVETPVTVTDSHRIFNVSERYARHRPSTEIMDPKMTSRTTDSGISSLGGHNSRSPSPSARSTASPLVPLVTGNAQLDLALEVHIHMCLQLVQNLGSFGPMKYKEKESVSKLIDQGEILGTIINRAKNPSLGRVNDLTSFPTLQLLWERITDTSSRCPFVVTADMCVHGLELEVRPVINYKYPKEPQLSNRVAKILTQSILDMDSSCEQQFNPSSIVTVFQFQLRFQPHHQSFYKLVEQIADEELLQTKILQEENGEVMMSILSTFGERLPPKKVLMCLIRFLISPDKELYSAVRDFISDLSCLHSNRRELIDVGLQMFESEWNLDRASACVLMSILEANSSAIDQLVYLTQSDPSCQVRDKAKESLISMGHDFSIVEQLTLSTHGFQGLDININA